MKTRLPKTLLVALMAAASYTAQAGYYQIGATFGTDLSDGTYKAEDIPCTFGRYAPTAKDGDCTLTIDGWVDNSIYVREGKVIVKDNDLTLSGYREMGGNGYVAMTVSGKNPELEVNGATLTLWAWSSAFHVGGLDGSGSLVVKNGGKFINEAGFSTWIGYSSHEEKEIGSIGFMNGHATTETTTGDVTKTTDRYKGTYYSGSSNPEFTFGRGSVLVTGNSYMNAGGMGALYIAEGVLTVEDNSKLESGNNPMHGVHVAEWGYKEGSTSVVNVTKNSEILMHQHLMTSSNSPDAKTFITVDDSTFTVKLGLYLSTVPEVANTYSELILKNGSTGDFGEVYAGAGSSVEGEGLAYIGIDKTSQLITSKIKANRGSQFDNKGDVKVGTLLLNGGSFDNYGTITADSVSLNSGVLNNAGTLNVKAQLEIAKAATLNCLAGSTISGVMPTGCTYAFTLSAKNLSVAGTTLAAGTEYSTSAPLTLKLAASENLYAGKYMLLDATQGIQTNRAATPAEVESVTGLGAKKEDIVWEDSILYYYLGENLVVAHDPLADAVQAANWGVYKSSQAFSSLLWAPRSNAVVVKNIEKPTADGKGSIMTTEVEGRTLAWGSVYSSFSRNSSSGVFAGAEYSIVGGAIGVERQFAR
ncbi:MAG: hypothetical protein IJN29_01965, partial [Akkermansia sp.]|nr:hypothetical protein [Akkermansia sp.]